MSFDGRTSPPDGKDMWCASALATMSSALVEQGARSIRPRSLAARLASGCRRLVQVMDMPPLKQPCGWAASASDEAAAALFAKLWGDRWIVGNFSRRGRKLADVVLVRFLRKCLGQAMLLARYRDAWMEVDIVASGVRGRVTSDSSTR
ncbi:unnamed protein product [Prorocentrum cordatum]|uniref:Uncharacterized protein n=1 Tax=Prorocentrum cordatum TaxID=2364126 RepID=A0ABN9RTR4_9DINO|nr:unnamed protein product [Polarella glacialis]